jgi:hypothetical protein
MNINNKTIDEIDKPNPGFYKFVMPMYQRYLTQEEKQQVKDKIIICPACNHGEHDSPDTELYHTLFKCECACNVERNK